jgi:hypothetical protein
MKKLHRKPALLALLGIAIASIGALCLPPGLPNQRLLFSSAVRMSKKINALWHSMMQLSRVIL